MELLLRPIDAVRRERLHLLIPAEAEAVLQRGVLTRRHGGEAAHVPRPRHLAGELDRAKDVRAVGSIDEALSRRARHTEGAPDPAAVEKLRPRPVESPEVALAPVAEIEDGRAFDEERPLLVEEGLPVTQVHDRGIHFNLTEVGIDGGVQREVRAEPDLGVRAGARVEFGAVIERIPGGRMREGRAARHVRHDLAAPRRFDPLDSHEIGEAGHEAAAIARRIDDEVELVLPGDVAAEIDAPHVLALSHEAQL